MSDKHTINPQVKYFSPRLKNKIEYIKKYRLTVIEAPSGFGKTTVIEHFMEHCISKALPQYTFFFEGHNPSDDWKQICNILRETDEMCAKKLIAAGPPDEDNLNTIGRIIREATFPMETYIWLDNYENWDIRYTGNFLDMLSTNLSSNAHVIITTQPLSSEKLGSFPQNANCLHISTEDLAFDEYDIKLYFKSAGVRINESQISELSALTEGWIMALSLQLTCYITSGRFEQGGMDALMENSFWANLSKKEQDFLLRISIFPKFTLQQAMELSELDADEIESIISDKRYFIHFDSESHCFYPHSQLRRLLDIHFGKLSKKVQTEIYLKGADFSLRTHDRVNTLRLYYLSGKWEHLFELPLTSYDIADLTDFDTASIVVEVVEKTSPEVKRKYPSMMIPFAFSLFFLGKIDRLIAMEDEISEIIDESSLTTAEKNALHGELELIISFLEFNRIEDMSAHHRKALQLLGGPAKLINIKSTWTFGSPSVLYLYWREPGKLDEELRQIRECIPVYCKLTGNHGFGADDIMEAEALFMRGETEKAIPLCYKALFKADSKYQTSIYQCGLFLMCRIMIHKGDKEELVSTLKSLHNRADFMADNLCRYTLDMVESYLCLLLGKPEEIVNWIAEGIISDKRISIMVQPFAYILYVRCILLKKQYSKLIGACEFLLELSSVFPNVLPRLYAYMNMAEGYWDMDLKDEAEKYLRKAMDLAMPDRIYIPFVENYIGLSPIFALIAKDYPQIEKIKKLYREYEIAWNGIPKRFTPRENDIHRLLKKNLTNKQIAEHLYLSPNTVRNIISSMLRKKGLASRQQLRELPEENIII